MARNGPDRLIRCSAFQQVGNRLVPEASGGDPVQSTSTGNGPERSADETWACRSAGIIDALFYPEWNEVVPWFKRATFLGLRDQTANCLESYFVERHAPYPIAIFNCYRNANEWRLKVET